MVALTTPVIIIDDVIHSGGTAMQLLVDLYERGFANTRHIFNQEVTSCKNAGKGLFNLIGFIENDGGCTLDHLLPL
jgi:hypothetical protein